MLVVEVYSSSKEVPRTQAVTVAFLKRAATVEHEDEVVRSQDTLYCLAYVSRRWSEADDLGVFR